MDFKKYIKKIYMFFVHPILFLKFTRKNSLVVMKRSEIHKISRISIGQNVRFGNDLRISIFDNLDCEPSKLFIGDNCYFCNRNSFLVGGEIHIGNNVLVASDVCFFSENHSMNPILEKDYKDQELQFDNVYVGDGCWIGEKVVILPGVSIGKRSIIGAGAVVTHDLPDYCIAVGNPARVIKKYNFVNGKWQSV